MDYNRDYHNILHTLWEHFICGDDDMDYSPLRPEVYASWQRSRAFNVDPHTVSKDVLSRSELDARIEANRELMDITHPYLEQIYSVVKGKGFYIELCDTEGYILDLIGDPEMMGHIDKQSRLVVGANRSEKTAGTNAIGTCLYEKKPVQIWGEEHYLASHKEYACSSAPIFMPDGTLAGCINTTGPAEDVHSHTLGMIMSSAGGIEKELNIRSINKDIERVSTQRNTIIQAISDGMILLGQGGSIIEINDAALRQLHLEYERCIGRNLFDIISIDGNSTVEEHLQLLRKLDKVTEVSILQPELSGIPAAFNIRAIFGGKEGSIVLCLYEQKIIDRLVNHIGGFKANYSLDSIIGRAPRTVRMLQQCQRAGKTMSNVLITGESGTGKELIAQAMHNISSHKDGPFVAVNCAALPKGLVESELFGYAKGAFTGASKDGNPGKFELANGGTIFLDEIGDMPLDVQTTLLRVLETREVVRIGGKYPKAVDVRVIAATNVDLAQAVEDRTFRKDLYYRLNVMTIDVPSLSERKEDIPLLVEHFVQMYAPGQIIRVSPEVYAILAGYSWPGNIRQLENVIERACNLQENGEILPEHLPSDVLRNTAVDTFGHPADQNADLTAGSPAGQPVRPSSSPVYSGVLATPDNVPDQIVTLDGRVLFADSKEAIEYALSQCRGNVTKAGKFLGISRRTMYRRIQEYGIDSGAFRP